MNILYTLNSASPGGMEQHVLDLVTGMAAREHSVTVACPGGVMAEKYKTAGAEVIEKDIRFEIDPVYISGIRKILIQKEINILHTHELKAAVNSLAAGYYAATPVRISHTHTPISEWKIDPIRKKVDTMVYSTAVNWFSHAEIALTESRKEAKILEGIDENKIKIIPNGLKVEDYYISRDKKNDYRHEIFEKYEIPEHKFLFGVISRVSREKGHTVLLEAFGEFLKAGNVDRNAVHLLIAGGGDMEEELRKKLSGLGISDAVTITGKFDEQEKVKIYSALDMFIFPSLAEGFGIVLIEAMASGLPIICSDLRVLQEVGGSMVYYFETGNSQNLAEKMYTLYMRGDTLDDLAEDGRKRVSDLYSMDKFVQNYLDLYSDLLELRS